MTDYRLFSGNATGQTDRGGFTDDLGVQFKVTTDGVHDATLNGFYFWAPSTGDFDHTKYSWRLYSSTNGTTGTLISGSTTNVAVDFTASSWNYQALASPITLTSGTTYYAVLHSTSTGTHYTGTDNYWSSGAGASGISSGPLFAPGTGTALNGAQNAYNEPSASAAFPTNSFGTNYWLDVSISYDGPITDVFTSSGTWTCPANVTSVDVACWGGGGAGGGGSVSGAAGGGGAGGSYAASTGLTVSPSTVYTVTVGAGGVADTTPSTNGATHDGGSSWFNTTGTILAQGGAGGQDRSTSGSGSGGTGSTASSVGTTKFAGGNGAAGVSASIGGGGGGGAGSTGVGGNASGSTAGTGTPLLGGNGSAGTSGSNAADGSAYGGGGGGARATSTTDRIGGDGGAGRVEITYQIITAVNANAGSAAATAAASGPTVTLAAHPAPAQAAATASTKTPVVAVGIPAGKAAVNTVAQPPAITDATSVSAGAAAATATVQQGSVGVAAPAGRASVTAAAYSVAPQNVFANAIPAPVRMEAFNTPLGIFVDGIDATATANDAIGQVDKAVDADVATVTASASNATGAATATGSADIAAEVDAVVNPVTIASSSHTPGGKGSATAAAYAPSLGIGIGSPPAASVTTEVLSAAVFIVGGSSAKVRALLVPTVERTYTIPHENRTIRIGRS